MLEKLLKFLAYQANPPGAPSACKGHRISPGSVGAAQEAKAYAGNLLNNCRRKLYGTIFGTFRRNYILEKGFLRCILFETHIKVKTSL